MDYDKILVIDQGKLKEFDSPIELMKDKESYFYKISKEM